MPIFMLQFRGFFIFVVSHDHYWYHILPLGFSSAPAVFSEIMVVVAAHLHHLEKSVFYYLNIWLLRGQSYPELWSAIERIILLFHRLVLQLNLEKSTLTPVLRIDFIAASLDAVTGSAYLSTNRFLTQKTLISGISVQPWNLSKEWSSAIGACVSMWCCNSKHQVTSSIPSVRTQDSLYIKQAQSEQTSVYPSGFCSHSAGERTLPKTLQESSLLRSPSPSRQHQMLPPSAGASQFRSSGHPKNSFSTSTF